MKNIFLVIATLILSVFSSACQFDTVEPGSVGVEVNMGKLNRHVYNPGFHFYSFMSDDLYYMSTQMQTYTFGGAREARRPVGDDEDVQINPNSHSGPPMEIISSQQMKVIVDITVQYHLNAANAPMIYQEFGIDYAEAIVEVSVRSGSRNAAEGFDTTELVTKREQFQNAMEREIVDQIAETLRSKHVDPRALIVDNVLLRQIDLPDNLENSILLVQQQGMQTLVQESAVNTARQQAERLRIEAEGQAAAQLIRAEGTANANRAISASLTPTILRLREFEAQYAMVANPNARIVVVPYGQPTLVNLPPMQTVAAAATPPAATPPARH